MSKKRRRNYHVRELEAHAQLHRLRLLAYENVTGDTLGEARGLICEAAQKLAARWKAKTSDVELVSSSQGVGVVVGVQRDRPPKWCETCLSLPEPEDLIRLLPRTSRQ